MVLPKVWFRLADGSTAALEYGDIIGRLDSAALFIDEPTVSQAHAMVTLREGELYLLSLRRLFAVSGSPTSEIRLAEGMEISLADGGSNRRKHCDFLRSTDNRIRESRQTSPLAGFEPLFR
ncbi:MAG: FHA domain-containing protein [Myxococcales bacterium]|nr:FHA domain-containing protein [Myxococcales bacterium]